MTTSFGRAIRGQFLLDDSIAYLNHGSFGATPRAVLDAAEAWRRRMEREPVRFMMRELPGLLRAAAERLGRFLGARGEDLVFVDNATTGVNAVLRSLDLAPGDELLTTGHVYGAVRRTLEYVAGRSGARAVEAAVPFPVASEDEMLAPIAAAITSRTRMIVVDHISSPTALIFPVARVAVLARERGIPILIDGAHAPGMLDLDIAALGADFYVGNCHKWLCAPKGCALLWTAPTMQAHVHPTVISHGLGRGYLAEFDWQGTRDASPWLAVTAALDFVEELGPGRMRAHNHDLACAAAVLLQKSWGTPVGGPPALLGSMATVKLPPALARGREVTVEAARALNAELLDRHAIEVPIMAFAGALWLRVSAQVYNEQDDYRRLARLADAA